MQFEGGGAETVQPQRKEESEAHGQGISLYHMKGTTTP